MSRWEDQFGIPLDDSRQYDAALIDWQALEELPTLSVGQADDLKVESNHQRVWLSRCTRLDGEHCDHHVTVETYVRGDRWETTSEN